VRNPGDILLVSCYELGHPPHGIALPLGFLRGAGFSPETIDLALEPLDAEKIGRARLAILSVPMHTALRLGVRVAERVREQNPSCHICCFGLYAWLNAEYLLEHRADSVLAGECEASLVALAAALERGDGIPPPGVRTREAPARPLLRRIPFPVPDRSSLRPLAEYAALESGGERRPAAYTEASRGCLHHCRHCPIPPVYVGRFFVVPREVVLEDIRRQVAAGAGHVTFGDPDFLNGPGHSLPIARALHREFPDLTFDFTAKIEHLLQHAALLPELGELGCLFIVSAVESLSDRVLEILDKGHTRRDVELAVAAVRSAGITLRPSLVPFTPWSGLDDYADLLDFAEDPEMEDAVDPVQLTVRLLVPPGSLLVDHPEMRPHLGPLVAERFSHTWTHPDPRMDLLHREVTALVEKAAHDREDPVRTLGRIRNAHARCSGIGELPLRDAPGRSPARRAPRLTESWFC
jgi:radical SAM superfamily enzyme YgiQ (UPF0313 family)